MSIRSTCRYIFILTISALSALWSPAALAQADTSAADTTHAMKKPELAGHQLSLCVDLAHPVANHYITDHFGYEFSVDYYMHNEFYLVADGGWGGSKVDYPDLKYTTTNNFLRFGFDKSIFARERPKDWDMFYFGLRAGFADVTRSDASYVLTDSLWGSSPGSTKGKSFDAIWLELDLGMRVELIKGLFGGWTVRGKFLMNGRSFSDLAPLYIAGYGRGDKNVAFDFNVFLSYGVRWNRKHMKTDTVLR